MQQIAILESEGSALRFHVEGDYNADDISDAVEGLIALLDKRFAPFDPDEPDFRSKSDGLPGEVEDAEPEHPDSSWTEWHTRGRHKENLGVVTIQGFSAHEDDEEDDPLEEDDDQGACDEDEISAGMHSYGWYASGPGCSIADPGGCYGDSEQEQMPNDVPMLPVYSAEFNIFNDKRTYLGISNLQSSFVGQDVRSADTGVVHNGRAPDLASRPGAPV